MAAQARHVVGQVPASHRLGGHRDGLGARLVAADRLVERDVEVEGRGRALVAGDQVAQQVAVCSAVQDALEDHVVTGLQGGPRRPHDETRRHRGRAVSAVFAQDGSAQVVLLDLTDRQGIHIAPELVRYVANMSVTSTVSVADVTAEQSADAVSSRPLQ
ncbi:hypothetical protein [Actinoplanes sp. NBRC 101535]|uniref:hypothetical protein n=1 Tax=Actinoplanes sp. NBRC 101535 TaxID=3032196 RepID=UPI0024A0045F|nr:hypothetical protein [Actinoplanes sp. NBRC 101535]GLY07754.1 hypothetical protein Acsp01_81330 [Actinoplanes sp. NBRC 101535]